MINLANKKLEKEREEFENISTMRSKFTRHEKEMRRFRLRASGNTIK